MATRDSIEAAVGEDEELAAQMAACKEADPPTPFPPLVYAKLLQKMFGEKAPEEPPELTAEGPVRNSRNVISLLNSPGETGLV